MVSTKFLFLSLLIYIVASILLFHYDPTGHFNSGNALSVTLTILGVGILFTLFMVSYKSELLFSTIGLSPGNLWSILKIGGGVLLTLLALLAIVSIVFSFMKEPPMSKGFFTVINTFVFATTVLFFLYLVKDYKFTNPYMRLIRNVIMYIPCLVYDFIDYVKYQYSITTPTAFIILGADIAFITMSYAWDKIKMWFDHRQMEGKVLLKGPIYMNEKTTIANFEDLKVVRKNKNFSYHYGVSFSVYINPQPPSTSVAYTEYSTLFDYGGKPTLLYKADENKLKIQVKINENEVKDIYLGNDMRLQRWNKFLINYDGGTLDVFLNDKLISSSSSIAPYMTLDLVSVGQNHGINGGIRDVVYFRNPVV
jgi:hypothetical protein